MRARRFSQPADQPASEWPPSACAARTSADQRAPAPCVPPRAHIPPPTADTRRATAIDAWRAFTADAVPKADKYQTAVARSSLYCEAGVAALLVGAGVAWVLALLTTILYWVHIGLGPVGGVWGGGVGFVCCCACCSLIPGGGGEFSAMEALLADATEVAAKHEPEFTRAGVQLEAHKEGEADKQTIRYKLTLTRDQRGSGSAGAKMLGLFGRSTSSPRPRAGGPTRSVPAGDTPTATVKDAAPQAAAGTTATLL